MQSFPLQEKNASAPPGNLLAQVLGPAEYKQSSRRPHILVKKPCSLEAGRTPRARNNAAWELSSSNVFQVLVQGG